MIYLHKLLAVGLILIFGISSIVLFLYHLIETIFNLER